MSDKMDKVLDENKTLHDENEALKTKIDKFEGKLGDLRWISLVAKTKRMRELYQLLNWSELIGYISEES